MTLTVSKVMLEYKPLGLNKNTFPFMYMLQTIKLKLVFNNVSPAFAIEVSTKEAKGHLSILQFTHYVGISFEFYKKPFQTYCD